MIPYSNNPHNKFISYYHNPLNLNALVSNPLNQSTLFLKSSYSKQNIILSIFDLKHS